MKPSSIVPACLGIVLAAGLASASAGTPVTPVHPALTIKTLDGGSFDLATKRGNWVIVNFWATWCSPCIKEMPELSAYVGAHANVAAIGLDYEETDRADVIAFLDEHPVVYPVAQVDTAHPPADFETPRGLPTTYLIAPDGSVAKRFIGPITARDLDQAIAAFKPASAG